MVFNRLIFTTLDVILHFKNYIIQIVPFFKGINRHLSKPMGIAKVF